MMSKKEEILAELNQIGKLALREVHAGTEEYQIWATENLDEMVDELIAKGPNHPAYQDERLPYWAEIWPSSLALAEYVQSAPEITAESTVLELGCGPGVAGLAAHRARRVTVSDYEIPALQLSRVNWLENLGREPAAEFMDWREPRLELAADVLLAADVAYEKRFFVPLINTFKTLLKPGGVILLSEPGRSVAVDFFECMQHSEFEAEQVAVKHGIDIWRFRRIESK
ncbi:methyltransferase [Verrucomicrobiota bacterium]